MKTTIRTYNFDLTRPDEAKAYDELKAKLKATPGRGKLMRSWGGGDGHYWFVRDLDGHELDLETACLFDNQWNTAPIDGRSDKGLRVFDWAEDHADKRPSGSMAPEKVRRGHYLDITDEMRAIRSETLKCGYCGAMAPAADVDQAHAFCSKCRDSEYLKESELFLTRLRPVADTSDRQPLSDAERDYLLPLYRDAQLHGSSERGAARIAAKRASIIAKAEKETAAAIAERDGLLWLMDRGLSVENVIYYSHTGRFGFGWRSPVEDSVVDHLLEHLSEFPFAYDIKTTEGGKHDGRTLSAEG